MVMISIRIAFRSTECLSKGTTSVILSASEFRLKLIICRCFRVAKKRSGAKKNERTPAAEQEASGETHSGACRQHFFETDNQCQRGDPENVHYAGNKEQSHQSPTAARTKCTVFETHPKRADPSFAPACHDEFEWAAATGEATLFQRRELKEAGDKKQWAAEPRARAGHC